MFAVDEDPSPGNVHVQLYAVYWEAISFWQIYNSPVYMHAY